MISSERLKKFKDLYKKHFKVDLTDEDAHEKASRLLHTVRMVYKPITERELEQLQKRQQELKKL